MSCLQLAFDSFYSGSSANDPCTMFSDCSLINQRNVGSEVKARANACKQFFLLEVESRVVAAVMEELGILSIGDIPKDSHLPSNLSNKTRKEKKKFIDDLSAVVVDKYVLWKDKVEQLLNKTKDAQNKEVDHDVGLTVNGRFECRFPGCDKTYKFDGKRRHEHEATHGLFVDEKKDAPKNRKDEMVDMFTYQTSLLELGMMTKNFFNAVSEGDGERVFRCWKFMLLYLKADGARSRKYALEAFYLICQFYSLLSERGAFRIIWNRFLKSSDGLGGNIPLDLALEHCNRMMKQVL